jgi:hypothetical protein
MICQVCNQDHNKPLEKWCDRSSLEIEHDKLKLELSIATAKVKRYEEALKHYANRMGDGGTARAALNKDEG